MKDLPRMELRFDTLLDTPRTVEWKHNYFPTVAILSLIFVSVRSVWVVRNK